MCMVETRSDRARGNAHDIGDHRRLVPEVVAKDENRALLWPEPSEGAIHDVSIDDTRDFIGRGLIVDGEHLQLRVPATVSTRVLDAHVREEPLDPEVEPVRIAEVRQVTPGDHQRVLQGILGPVDVSEDPTSDREQAIDTTAEQVDERDLISTLRRDHELSIHRRHSVGRPSGTSSNCSGGW